MLKKPLKRKAVKKITGRCTSRPNDEEQSSLLKLFPVPDMLQTKLKNLKCTSRVLKEQRNKGSHQLNAVAQELSSAILTTENLFTDDILNLVARSELQDNVALKPLETLETHEIQVRGMKNRMMIMHRANDVVCRILF